MASFGVWMVYSIVLSYNSPKTITIWSQSYDKAGRNASPVRNSYRPFEERHQI
jgi:hypothetical protein